MFLVNKISIERAYMDVLAEAAAADIRSLDGVEILKYCEHAVVVEGRCWQCPRVYCVTRNERIEIELLYLPFEDGSESEQPSRKGALSNASSRFCSPELHPSTAQVTLTALHLPAAAVEPVVRLRVLSVIYHPLVDPDTNIFQQELAKQLLLRDDFSPKTAFGTSDLVKLFSWAIAQREISLKDSLGDDCVPSVEDLIEYWTNNREACPIPHEDLISSSDHTSKVSELRRSMLVAKREHAERFSNELHHRGAVVGRAIKDYSTLMFHKSLFLTNSFAQSNWRFVRELLDERLIAFFDTFGTSLASSVATSVFKSCGLLRSDSDGVFSFPLLSSDGCAKFAREVQNYESFDPALLPRFRPNSMNRRGLILNEIGLKPLLTFLCHNILFPIAEMVMPEHTHERTLDDHHSFVVEYAANSESGDTFLDMHSDDSEVTFQRKFDGHVQRLIALLLRDAWNKNTPTSSSKLRA